MIKGSWEVKIKEIRLGIKMIRFQKVDEDKTEAEAEVL